MKARARHWIDGLESSPAISQGIGGTARSKTAPLTDPKVQPGHDPTSPDSDRLCCQPNTKGWVLSSSHRDAFLVPWNDVDLRTTLATDLGASHG